MKNKGITLVALVVSIIIMLILAGVTLNIALGENGLLKMATQSVDKYKEASEEEQRQTARLNAIMNKETYKYTTKDGKTVSIPAGFVPTQIDGEDSVNDGLVIVDSEGNEFVWIPVGSYNGENGKYDTINYENAHMLSTTENWSKDTTYASKNGWENPENQIATGKSSIEKYGGFYVARYEAGVPSNASFYVEKNKEDKTYTKEDKKM